jgi:hypothetical protein
MSAELLELVRECRLTLAHIRYALRTGEIPSAELRQAAARLDCAVNAVAPLDAEPVNAPKQEPDELAMVLGTLIGAGDARTSDECYRRDTILQPRAKMAADAIRRAMMFTFAPTMQVDAAPPGAHAPLSFVTSEGILRLSKNVLNALGIPDGGNVAIVEDVASHTCEIAAADRFFDKLEKERIRLDPAPSPIELATLEIAALVAEGVAKMGLAPRNQHSPDPKSWHDAAEECARRIRALKVPPR